MDEQTSIEISDLRQRVATLEDAHTLLDSNFQYHTHSKWDGSSAVATQGQNIRVQTITTAASYTINSNLYDQFKITALAGALNTLDVSGAPVDGQKLIVRIKDNGTSQTITWSSNFASYGSTLPTATTISKVLTIGLMYFSEDSIWGCVALQIQP